MERRWTVAYFCLIACPLVSLYPVLLLSGVWLVLGIGIALAFGAAAAVLFASSARPHDQARDRPGQGRDP
jgi:hypothetical protein